MGKGRGIYIIIGNQTGKENPAWRKTERGREKQGRREREGQRGRAGQKQGVCICCGTKKGGMEKGRWKWQEGKDRIGKVYCQGGAEGGWRTETRGEWTVH